MHKVKLLHQEAVMRGEVDLLVKPPVGARQLLRMPQQRAVVLDHVAQHAHLLGRGMARGQLRRQPLEFGAHHVKLGQSGCNRSEATIRLRPSRVSMDWVSSR